MAKRINSSLVFSLMNRAYNCRNARIYDLLLFDQTTGGPRFKDGHNPNATTCHWPSQRWSDNVCYEHNVAKEKPNHEDYKKAWELCCQEENRTLPAALNLETALGVWCYYALFEAFTTGQYQDNQVAAKTDIISVCRNYGISKRKLNYYAKFTISVEKTIGDIIAECERSSGMSFDEDDEITSFLILHDIRAFLEGQTTDKGIVFKSFLSNEAFVKYLFPQNCIDDFMALSLPYDVIVECSNDDEYSKKIGDKFLQDNGLRTRKVVANCLRLYADINNADALYDGCITTLANYITNVTTKEFIVSCIRRCTDNRYPYRGFAVLVLAALLGETQFKRVYHDVESAYKWIRE